MKFRRQKKKYILVIVILMVFAFLLHEKMISYAEDLSDSEPSGLESVNSGESDIALHSLTWVSGTPDGTDLSMTPEKNTVTRAVYQIDFSKGGEEEIPAGQIEIRVPAHLFFDRDGQPADTVSVPLAKAPDEYGDTGFHYTIDEQTGEIVIKNYENIEASYHFTCKIGYSFVPYQVADGYKKEDIQATFQVRDSKGSLSATSESLSVNVHTKTEEPRIYKSVSEKYETWQDTWGEKPADAEDFIYVEWQVRTSVARGTQPFRLTYQEEIGSEGTLVGWGTTSGKYTLGNEETYENTIFYDSSPRMGATTSDVSSTHYVLVKYPRTMLETTQEIKNKCTACLDGYDGDNHRSTAESKYTYSAPDLSYKGDNCRIDKNGGNHVTGGINLLENGKSAGTYYSISTTTRGYGMTNDGADPYTTILEDNILAIGGKRLDPEDYSFTEFSVSDFREYGFKIDPEKGYQEVQNTDYASYQPISVQVKTTANPDQWEELGKITRQANGTYQWTGSDHTSGTVTSSKRVPLPEGTYDIRLLHTGTVYQVRYGLYLYYELHPTDHVTGLIKGTSSFQLKNVGSAFALDKDGKIGTSASGGTGDSQLQAIAKKADQEQYGQSVSHATGSNDYSRLKPTSSYVKRSATPVSDVKNSQEKVDYTLTYYEQVTFSSVMTRQDVKDLGVIKEQRDSVFYDLLPMGMTIDTSTIKAQTYDRYSEKQKTCSYTVELIDNWKASGRTMVKIHVKAPEGEENFDSDSPNTKLCSGFAVKFMALNSWQNIGDYGATVRNSSAYYSLDGELVSGVADTGGTITDKELFYDLDGDGNPAGAKNNVRYAECTTNFQPLTAAELGFRKSVKAADGLRYQETDQVAAAGNYTYQLRFALSRNTDAKNIVMYDVLESAYGDKPYWKGTLKSINTAQPETKGIAPVIYYSTYQKFENLTLNQDQTDLTNDEIWSTTPPSDLAEVTAIAIDLRYKTDETEYVFSPEEAALCYVTMTAPENYQDYADDPNTEEDESVYAYNSAYLLATTVPVAGGAEKTAIEECSPVTVSMRAPDVELHKTSDPESGTKDQPAKVQEGDTITYHLVVSNKGKGEAVYHLNIEDVVPEGLSIQKEKIQTSFDKDGSAPSDLELDKRVTLSKDGQKLDFSVDKLDAGESLHLWIPVTVEESGKVFENTAVLNAFNGKTWQIESETTWHRSPGGYELPDTGGKGTGLVYFTGAVLLVTAFAGWKKRNEKKKPS